MKSDEKFIEKWKMERKKGKFKYILIQIIKYFLTMLIGVAIITFFAVLYTGTDILTIQLLKKTLLSISAVTAGAGTHYSYSLWKEKEKRYNQLTKNEL